MNTNMVSGHTIHDEPHPSRGPLLIGILLVLALVVAGGTILWQGSSAAQTAAPLAAERFLAANPELKAAQSYAAWSSNAAGEADLSAAAILARNPELRFVARDAFDYEQAADVSAYRWIAMAKSYERMGLLNRGVAPGELSASGSEATAYGVSLEALARAGRQAAHSAGGAPADPNAYAEWLDQLRRMSQ